MAVEIRCRSGDACLNKTPDGPALVARDTLCHACCAELQAKLNELPTIYKVLNLFKGGLWGESGEAKVSSSSEPPCPLRVEVVDLQTEIRAALKNIQGIRIVDLVNMQDGIPWALEVRKLWSQADRIIGISQHWSRRAAPCDSCGSETLGSWAGEDSVSCFTCGVSMTRTEYSKHCLQSVTRQKKGKI